MISHRILSPFLLSAVLLASCTSNDSSKDVSGPFFKSIATDRTVNLTGLRDRVEVLHDDQGVPHIYAKNEADALLVQGYVSARDRFFQMEMIRKSASGRISELFGKLSPDDTEEADIEMRKIMMTERGTMVFDELEAALNPSEKQRIRAYSAGINGWINDAKAGRNGSLTPYQYEENPFIKAQGLQFADVAPWTVADSLAVGRLQQWNLSGSLGDELNIGRLRATLPAPFFTETYRYEPADTTVSVHDFFSTTPPFSGLLQMATGSGNLPTENLKLARQLGATLERWRNAGRQYGRSSPGSNNWVVGPKLTKGAAMLANDPHLTILNPPLFYHTHLNTSRFGKGQWDAIGVTFPGVPGLLIGHNQHLAWGVTTLGYDVVDLYKEKLSNGAVTFNGASVPVAYSKQEFRFGTGAKATVKTIEIPYVPHHGAVVSGEKALTGADEDLITMKWTGREITADFRAFFDLLPAKNIDDFFRAVHYFDIGAQSFVGADVDGNIGFFGHALVPQRPWDLEVFPPDSPLPGLGKHEWNGYLPDSELVQAKNPAQGYIATANNDIVGTTADNNPFNDEQYYWYLQDIGFRIARISQLIEAMAPVSLEDMEAIQNDTFSLEAERVVPLVLGTLATVPATDAAMSAEIASAIGYLKDWEFGTPTGVTSEFRTETPSDAEKVQAVGASIYFIFQDFLIRRLMEDDYAAYDLGVPGWIQGSKFMIYALENTATALNTAHWFDDIRTPGAVETPANIMLLALADTVADLKDRFKSADPSTWLWGKIHRVEGGDVISLATGSSTATNGPVANDGSQYTVDVADFNGDGLQHSGAQIRFVAEMKAGAIVSRSVIPGGQVDAIESTHRADQWDEWVTNKRLPYRFYDADVEQNVEQKWVFLPR